MSQPVAVLAPRDRARVAWRISSHSNNTGGSCVEAGPLDDATGRVAVRHSHRPDGTAFLVGRTQWANFVAATRSGELVRESSVE